MAMIQFVGLYTMGSTCAKDQEQPRLAELNLRSY